MKWPLLKITTWLEMTITGCPKAGSPKRKQTLTESQVFAFYPLSLARSLYTLESVICMYTHDTHT